jgi:hypothetical protein
MTYGKNSIFRHIKSNNSGMAKVKIVKNERDPLLFTSNMHSSKVDKKSLINQGSSHFAKKG